MYIFDIHYKPFFMVLIMVKLKKQLSRFDRFVLVINCLLALLLLLSYLAPITNPQVFWPVAFLGLCYPLLLVSNLFFIVYWLFRRKKHTLLSVVCVLVGLRFLMGSFGFHLNSSDSAKKSAKYIRVMTYNVHDFNISFPDEEKTKPLMLQLINEQQPDVIAFEEYYSWRKQNSYQVCDSLKRILKSNYYCFEPFAGTTTYDIGLAIYSKFPIVGYGLIGDKSDSPGMFVDVVFNKKPFRVYCLHLQSMHFEPRDYKYVDTISNYGKVNIHSSLHIITKLKAAFIKRSQQVKVVKQHAAQCPYPYVFLGDFNDTPASYAVNELERGLKNAFNEKGHGFSATFNGDVPNYQIDYIMPSTQFDVVNYEVIKQDLSDHYPVRSDLLLK